MVDSLCREPSRCPFRHRLLKNTFARASPFSKEVRRLGRGGSAFRGGLHLVGSVRKIWDCVQTFLPFVLQQTQRASRFG